MQEATKRAQPAHAARAEGPAAKPSLNDIIKESNNPEAERLKGEIDGVRKERGKYIIRIKECRRRLSYKEAESVAITNLLKMEGDDAKKAEKRRRFGYLKRLKNRLEFKISTEASSLADEKELIRKIDEINKELKGSLASVRLERKLTFVKKDIEVYNAELTGIDTKIVEMDKKLDALYAELRKVLGITSWQGKTRVHKKKVQNMPIPEINLEDIAVIKKKESK